VAREDGRAGCGAHPAQGWPKSRKALHGSEQLERALAAGADAGRGGASDPTAILPLRAELQVGPTAEP
jgi:hypothetical protein